MLPLAHSWVMLLPRLTQLFVAAPSLPTAAIDQFVSTSPGKEAAGHGAAGGGSRPPQDRNVQGAAVVKDFVDDATGILRPFRGTVTAIRRHTRWCVYSRAVGLYAVRGDAPRPE